MYLGSKYVNERFFENIKHLFWPSSSPQPKSVFNLLQIRFGFVNELCRKWVSITQRLKSCKVLKRGFGDPVFEC